MKRLTGLILALVLLLSLAVGAAASGEPDAAAEQTTPIDNSSVPDEAPDAAEEASAGTTQTEEPAAYRADPGEPADEEEMNADTDAEETAEESVIEDRPADGTDTPAAAEESGEQTDADAEETAEESGVGTESPASAEPEAPAADGDITASGTCGSGSSVTWRLTDDGVLTFSGSGDMWAYNQYMTSVPWSSYKKQITAVVIEQGVTNIGGYAFKGFSQLTEVTLADSVTTIGIYAFDSCSALSTITIGKGLKRVGTSAFLRCYDLTGVYITDPAAWCGTVFIDTYANPLYYAHNLYVDGVLAASFTVPNGVSVIQNSVFTGCTCMSQITIPASVTSIGNHAFSGCTGLTGVYISDLAAWCRIEYTHSVADVVVDSNPLIYAHNLYINGVPATDITIPAGITSIGPHTFEGCSSLTEVTLPNGVTNIGDDSFADCSGLVSVVLPDSLTGIGRRAFQGCSSLRQITIPNSVTKILYGAFSGCTALTEITVPNGITQLSGTFSGCTGLKEITIPDSVTDIGGAFSGCTGLTEITIPDNVTDIGGAFSGCTGLTEITIPDSVTDIGEKTFSGCTGLTEIIIPDNVTDIGANAFSDCTALTDITFGSGLTGIGGCAFTGCTELTEFVVPDTVTSIGYRAFSGCTGLRFVYIPASVTGIGNEICLDCDSSVEIYCQAEQQQSGWNASWNLYDTGKTCLTVYGAGHTDYAYWSTLDRSAAGIVIPDDVSVIPPSAFKGCSALTNVTVGSGVKTIGDYAFAECTGLTKITLGSGVTTIGINAFAYCRALSEITLSGQVTDICDYAFRSCSALTELTLPDSVVNIGEGAFCNCTGLKEFTFGSGVASVGLGAFYGDTALTRVNIGSQEQWDAITFSTYGSNPLDMGAVLYINGTAAADGYIGLGVAARTQEEITAYYESIGGADTLYHATVYTTAATSSTPGVLSDETIDAALATLNFVRYVAGLNYHVTVTDELNEKAQAISFVNCLNGVIDHTPARPDGISDALYSLAYNAGQQSNLACGYNCLYSLGSMIISGWMDDSDEDNRDVLGHRRWCLDPRMSVTGFGMTQSGTDNYGAMIAFTDDISDVEYTETNIAWPAANTPVELFPDAGEAWSLTLGDLTVYPNLTAVTLTRMSDGRVWHFSTDEDNCDGYFSVSNESAGIPGCIIFIPEDVGGYAAGDEFTVEINMQYEVIKYTVSFFSLSGRQAAEPTPTPTAVPTATPTAAPTAAPSAADTADKAAGDINGDGKVNIVDALRLFRAVNGQIDAVSPAQGDLNDDGKVNVVDALKLFRFVNGQIKTL